MAQWTSTQNFPDHRFESNGLAGDRSDSGLRHSPSVRSGGRLPPAARGEIFSLKPLASRDDEHFVRLMGACRSSGGLARVADVITLLGPSCGLDLPTVARWIVARKVISLNWQGDTWLPVFQFSGDGVALRPAVGALLNELSGVFGDWELADWFTQANSALLGYSPLQMLDTDPAAVLHAARQDRFVAVG